MTSCDHPVALINAFTVPVGEFTPLLGRWRDGADSDSRLLPSGWGAVLLAVRLV